MSSPPPIDQSTLATRFWTLVDQRINALLDSVLRARFGQPRARYLTLNVPLAGELTPSPGWLTSVVLDSTCRVVTWEIMALVPGTVTIDVRYSAIPASPGTVPSQTSMPGLAYPSLNGYAVYSQDTSAWAHTQVQAGMVMHFYVLAASGIQQAVLGLTMMDLDGRVLQP